jgi:pre-mRNA cleavage complex 2 protein Pcf11
VLDLKQDFLASLRDDLTFNSRPVIMNLTQIAGENIGAAPTIAKSLEEHIQRVDPWRRRFDMQASPTLKLPALYLLDSICKNVGSPYPLLFGRNIYKTFMDAYTLVDISLRRKFEELLLTWKEPTSTGNMTPIFPADVTRKIETALLRAKTLALQLEQRRQREVAASGLTQHRNTPTLNYPMGWTGSLVLTFGCSAYA